MKFIADMHTHTIASTHAYSTITENAAAAAKAGIRYLGMTDHGEAMTDSPHNWHFYNMEILPREIHGVKVIRGIEANILDFEGHIDVPYDMYDVLEWIVASFHHPCCFPGTKAQNTAAYLKALENPRVNVIGHSETPDFDYDFDEVTKLCAKQDKLIEVNVSRLIKKPKSALRYKEILKFCEKNGTKVIVDSDAHYSSLIGRFDTAEKLFAEMNFPEELVINADLNRFEAYLKANNILN